MPMYYKLGTPGVTSVSIDGIEHKVNPETGFLEVHMLSPNLKREIAHHRGIEINLDDKEQMEDLKAQAKAEEEERLRLFVKLDEVLGRKIDRRRSLAQLREQWADYQARQAAIVGTNPTLNAALR
jgi:hypothetical protein